MKKAWFFDLDGTLADTDRDIREAWKAAMAELGLKRDDFDEVFVAGPPIDVMLQNLFPQEYTPELAQKMRAAFGRHYDHDGFPNTREYPSVIDRVKQLKAAGVPNSRIQTVAGGGTNKFTVGKNVKKNRLVICHLLQNN